ncbi:MAG: dipicolinate synthase subunit B [Clostridiales bacterium]|nr:dipicolinate synthase subunit B [Clostridiales bacterium]
MAKTKVGFALTGSFCTFTRAFDSMKALKKLGYEIVPILSYAAAKEDTRFYSHEDVWRILEEISENKPLSTLSEVEPIGPKKLVDAYIIAPMTGASMAKMAHGIFDTPALLGAKSHLRNSRPVLIAPSTNDGLSTAAENIGKILGMRNVYIVPYAQDDPIHKPRSLVADFAKIPEALAAALAGGQLQPILLGGLKSVEK